MIATQKYGKVTRATFLEYLDSIEGKAEFLDGEIYDMSSGTPAHSLIANNIGGLFFAKLNGKGCRAYNSYLTIEIPYDGAIVFPDVSVICGESIGPPDQPEIVTNPTLIVEVLSKDDASHCLGRKFKKYMSIPSLKEYVLIDQYKLEVEVRYRHPSGLWDIQFFDEIGQEIPLQSLDVKIPMAEIYRDVIFGEAPDLAS